MVAKGDGEVGGGKDWEFGINRCKLVYIGWINNKDLLYSTRKYIQYLVITYKEKESEKEKKIYIYRYIYKTESLFCTPETNTTL